MKAQPQPKKATPKGFSVKTLDKTSLKARAFKSMQTSFAIEGIRFSKSQLNTLRAKSHSKK